MLCIVKNDFWRAKSHFFSCSNKHYFLFLLVLSKVFAIFAILLIPSRMKMNIGSQEAKL